MPPNESQREEVSAFLKTKERYIFNVLMSWNWNIMGILGKNIGGNAWTVPKSVSQADSIERRNQ